jgi:Sec-independent protein secretion pathway component TatC
VYNGKLKISKTRKVFAIIVVVAFAVILILQLTNVISQNFFSLSMLAILAVGLLTVVLINRYEKNQTNKLPPPPPPP